MYKTKDAWCSWSPPPNRDRPTRRMVSFLSKHVEGGGPQKKPNPPPPSDRILLLLSPGAIRIRSAVSFAFLPPPPTATPLSPSFFLFHPRSFRPSLLIAVSGPRARTRAGRGCRPRELWWAKATWLVYGVLARPIARLAVEVFFFFRVITGREVFSIAYLVP